LYHLSYDSKVMLKVAPLILATLTVPTTAQAADAPFQWHTGDIIVQEGASDQAKAIKAATDSPWSHVGMIVFKNQRPYVFEAIQPVTLTPVDKFIKRSHKSNFKILRLKKPAKKTPLVLTKSQVYVTKQLNKNYDLKFEWSDTKMYCSELVWKTYKNTINVELCAVRKFSDYNLDHPAVKKMIDKRYGGKENLPMDHKIIAPSDIVKSELLKDVTASYKAAKSAK